MEEKIKVLVNNAILEMNEMVDDDEQFTYSEDAKLFGGTEGLDSFALVSLISILEEMIEDEFDREIILVPSEEDMLSKNPFRTIKRLEEYILELLTTEEV